MAPSMVCNFIHTWKCGEDPHVLYWFSLEGLGVVPEHSALVVSIWPGLARFLISCRSRSAMDKRSWHALVLHNKTISYCAVTIPFLPGSSIGDPGKPTSVHGWALGILVKGMGEAVAGYPFSSPFAHTSGCRCGERESIQAGQGLNTS